MENLERNIDAANNMVITEEEIEEAPAQAPVELPQVTDLYQARQDVQRDYSKKQFPRGSSAMVLSTIKDAVGESLAWAYKKAKSESDALKANGENRRAQIVINQYMAEDFLPAVELVANIASPDELLNSVQGLKMLDSYALGVGSMSGYTSAYIREAYANQLGNREALSDPSVAQAILRINGLCDTDQMMAAKGLASKMKREIDAGEHLANQSDYDFISRVASFGRK